MTFSASTKTPHLPAKVSGAFSWAGFPGAPYP
nr:MAG TPA: hypothetical protein [Caudoviricetes sp.]